LSWTTRVGGWVSSSSRAMSSEAGAPIKEVPMPGMVPEDVFELTGASDPRFSPDGATVAYVVVGMDREANRPKGAIWLAPADGSSPPRRFTSGTGADANPRWSPDGQRLAFTSKRDDDAAQLYVIPVGGGEARKLTDLEEDVQDPAWSPDGDRIAFTSRVRDKGYAEKDEKRRPPRRISRLQYRLDNVGWTADRRTHVLVAAADGSAPPSQLTEGDFEDEHPSWSPDGRRIAFASARHEDWDLTLIRDVYVVEAEGGEPERVTHMDGSCSRPSWSPNGERIAHVYYPGHLDDPRHFRIAVVDLGSGERVTVGESLDRTAAPGYEAIREPLWQDENTLVFAVEDSGNVPLYRAPADGSGRPEALVEGDSVLLGYDVHGGRIAQVRTTPTELPELYVDDRKLSEVGRPFAQARDLSVPERFTALSTGGVEVEAWVMRPAGFKDGVKYPALLNIHGGPFTQYGNKFFDEFQIYAGAGYVVVYSNPRGSSGYSEEWGRAIRGPGEAGPGWGSVDYDDVMAVMGEAIKRFEFIDVDRLGVMGGSYGGYLTSWIVGHTDMFRAAISERSVNSFVSQWGSSDFGFDLKGYIGTYLFEDVDAWTKPSPATYAQDIETPLLILHSENDLRCNIEQAEQLFTTLRVLKRKVEMVRFPSEGHELSRSGSPIHRVMRFEIILDWWRRHLKD
jgi:dipeptidyl aminopeptidase/acylaminoacyl peptidase